MPVFNPNDLEVWTGGAWEGPECDAVHGFSIDTRKIREGEMFVALRSEQRDGHDYLKDALVKGASCALVSRLVPEVPLPQLLVDDSLNGLQRLASAHRRSFSGPVVAVTGSCGKTSTKDLLANLLASRGPVLRTPGNCNNHIGVPLTVLELDPRRHIAAVIEAGIDRIGEMAVLTEIIQPTQAVITLVAPVHLQGLGSLETIAREKVRIAEWVNPTGFAVFPYSCLQYSSFHNLKCRVLVGKPRGTTNEEGDISFDGTIIPFLIERGRKSVRVRFEKSERRVHEEFVMGSDVSRGMASNAALAIIAALAMGVEKAAVRECLAGWRAASFRGEIRRSKGKEFYIDCYNANPVALQDALDAFAFRSRKEGGARLYIIGSMEELGSEAPIYHFNCLKNLRLGPDDRVYLTGFGAEDMAAGLRAAGNSDDQYEIVTDLNVVSERLETFEGAVFLKGSRHYRLEQILDGYTDEGDVAC